MSSALAGPVPRTLVGQKSSVSFPNSKKADSPSYSHRHSHPECPVHPPSLSMARVVPTIESMSYRQRPTILLLMDNFSPFSFSNLLTLAMSMAT